MNKNKTKNIILIIMSLFFSINNILIDLSYAISESDKKIFEDITGKKHGRDIMKELCEKNPQLPQCQPTLKGTSSDETNKNLDVYQDTINYSCFRNNNDSVDILEMITYYELIWDIDAVKEKPSVYYENVYIGDDSVQECIEYDTNGNCVSYETVYVPIYECQMFECIKSEECQNATLTIKVTKTCYLIATIEHWKCIPWYGKMDRNFNEIVASPLNISGMNDGEYLMVNYLSSAGSISALQSCISNCTDKIASVTHADGPLTIRTQIEPEECTYLSIETNCQPDGC